MLFFYHEKTTQHAHSCTVGGRVIHRYDDITNELKNWCTKVLSRNTIVWNKPSIFPVSPSAATNQNVSDGPVCNSLHHINSNQGDRGDLLVRDLWDHGAVETIIDVRVTDLDSKSQISKKADNIKNFHHPLRHHQSQIPLLPLKTLFKYLSFAYFTTRNTYSL